jgi:hypothetical protein
MTTTTATCIHRWRIAEVESQQSPGTCQHCGAQRVFNNTLETPLPIVPFFPKDWMGDR